MYAYLTKWQYSTTFLLIIESRKSSLLSHTSLLLLLSELLTFCKYIFSTIKGIINLTFCERLHKCLVCHSPCLFIKLQYEEAVPAKSEAPYVTTHFLASEIIICVDTESHCLCIYHSVPYLCFWSSYFVIFLWKEYLFFSNFFNPFCLFHISFSQWWIKMPCGYLYYHAVS
jgi:hypothetical protein